MSISSVHLVALVTTGLGGWAASRLRPVHWATVTAAAFLAVFLRNPPELLFFAGVVAVGLLFRRLLPQKGSKSYGYSIGVLVFAFFCRFVAGQIGVDALGDTDAAWRAVFPALFIIACDDVGIWDEIVSLTGLTTLARLTLVLCFGKDLLG